MSQKIKISELPYKIRQSIPKSIKAFSDEYSLEDLPSDIRYQVEEFLSRDKSISYSVLYDAICEISEYGDFIAINDVYNLVVEYLKNYLQISQDSYPFDPSFYSELKHYLHKKNTSLQYRLVSNEINQIVDSISEDLDLPIELIDLEIKNRSINGGGVEIYAMASIRINNVEKQFNISLPT
ncbi:MAG: hypothetical protein ACOC22_01995 [bacterium]